MLGAMLYLDTQKGKEATKTDEFLEHIRGNTACTKRD